MRDRSGAARSVAKPSSAAVCDKAPAEGRAAAAATASCPRLKPPSFGGTRRWRYTRKPRASSCVTTSAVSSAFMNTPPLSHHRLDARLLVQMRGTLR